MAPFGNRFGIQKTKPEWENPKECVGEKQGEIQNGKYTCWRPIQRAEKAWEVLRPQVKEFLNHCGGSSTSVVMLEMYMIGRTEDNAVPTILICSEDKKTRVLLRKSIKTSNLLSAYPGIGLGDASMLPDRRKVQLVMEPLRVTEFASQRYFEKLRQLSESKDYLEQSVEREEGIIGRQLILLTANGECNATGGLIIYIKNKAYQLTAGHASAGAVPTDTGSALLSDDCDFDGQSDDEDSISSSMQDLDVTSRGSHTPETASIAESDCESAVEEPSNASSAHASDMTSFTKEALHQVNEPAGSSTLPTAGPSQYTGKGSAIAVFSPTAGTKGTSEMVGTVVMSTEDLAGSSLDYALIALEGANRPLNSITYYNGRTHITMKIKQQGQIGPVDTDILAITSTGVRIGRLSSLASSIRLPGKNCFQDVYPIYLGQVNAGDCGSAVIDQESGEFYGHIIAGTHAGSVAYIVPAADILGDITRQFGGPVLLERDDISHPSQQSPFILPIRASEQTPQQVGISTTKRGRMWWGLRPTRLPGSSVDRSPLVEAAQEKFSFDELFLLLPNELKLQIITSLPLSDILNLRLASRAWHAIISFNELPITRYYLQHCIPRYALRLYPVSESTKPNLHYLYGIWHRLHVAAKLAFLITERITKEIFLRNTEAQRNEFAPQSERMRRQLIPRVYTLFHFFETYRAHHVRFVEEHGYGLNKSPYTINPIEAEIMSLYDDTTLLKCHEIFPLLVSSFVRRLRPPVFASRVERSIKGYLKDKPADEIYAAIFCIGGLRQVERFWEMKGYNARRDAVDTWYNTMSPEYSEPSTRARRGLLAKLSFAAKDSKATQQESKPLHPRLLRDLIRSDSDTGRQTSGLPRPELTPDILIFGSSLSAGMPMGPLTQEQLRLVASDLPTLQNIWLQTAEALILDRCIVQYPQDIKRNAQVLLELIDKNSSLEDEWWYGNNARESIRPPLETSEEDPILETIEKDPIK